MAMMEHNEKGKEAKHDDDEEDEEEEEQQEVQEIWSWGAGTEGQLGTGRLEDEHLPQLLHLPSLASAGPISLLTCGGAHVIALTSGATLPFLFFVFLLLKKKNILFSSSNSMHLISLLVGGRVLTWGRGTSGQLGHGDIVNSLYPKLVASLQAYFIAHVSAGWSHSGFVSGSFLCCNFLARVGGLMILILESQYFLIDICC
jgi:alpha-tubulin suppressor-like RCC1 family protein